VGSASGTSTSASSSRRPGKSIRTSTQATSRPSSELIDAAISDAPSETA
jgi:hypothetical protein